MKRNNSGSFAVKNIHILITDDEPGILDLLEEELTELGYMVSVATNGKECLDKINENKPDILILDIKMPDMSGIEVLQKLKRNKKTKDIYVIMNTVRTLEREIEHVKSLGVDAYVCKPSPFSSILLEIEKGIDMIKKKKNTE